MRKIRNGRPPTQANRNITYIHSVCKSAVPTLGTQVSQAKLDQAWALANMKGGARVGCPPASVVGVDSAPGMTFYGRTYVLQTSYISPLSTRRTSHRKPTDIFWAACSNPLGSL